MNKLARICALLSALLLAGPASAQMLTWQSTSRVVPVAAVATGTTGPLVVTLPPTTNPNYLLFICGFDVTAISTTNTGPITVENVTLANITLTYFLSTAGSGNAAYGVLEKTFTPCLPAAVPANGIVVRVTADPQASNVTVNVIGYQQLGTR